MICNVTLRAPKTTVNDVMVDLQILEDTVAVAESGLEASADLWHAAVNVDCGTLEDWQLLGVSYMSSLGACKDTCVADASCHAAVYDEVAGDAAAGTCSRYSMEQDYVVADSCPISGSGTTMIKPPNIGIGFPGTLQ